ncbi:hypothetical protein NUW54_g704 [Trametes sanguinea]|uniref:Uncharacterized protein n=2 Tax=Trametes sanguinea TaxID=158606 RepID=A0ACC1Q9X0_9APHY|nr:hypothetical protein NUW54_g2126 [Trametes sanguinea]KAJ3016910.1 hypothetical protein NUW54_g704 [Trametes sanguinea]
MADYAILKIYLSSQEAPLPRSTLTTNLNNQTYSESGDPTVPDSPMQRTIVKTVTSLMWSDEAYVPHVAPRSMQPLYLY